MNLLDALTAWKRICRMEQLLGLTYSKSLHTKLALISMGLPATENEADKLYHSLQYFGLLPLMYGFDEASERLDALRFEKQEEQEESNRQRERREWTQPCGCPEGKILASCNSHDIEGLL